MLAVRVRSLYAEKMRRVLVASGLIDRNRRISAKDGFVEIPICEGKLPEVDFEYEVVQQREPIYSSKKKINFKILKEKLVEEFGKDAEKIRGGWELIGDILIIDLPVELEDRKFEVGEKLHQIFPKVKSIARRKSIVGEVRRPNIELLYGNSTETIHRENYCAFKIDISKVMFSAGNIEERRRMAFISGPDEVVVDMFAGIGQFSIPIARHSQPKKVYAIEKNPIAYKFLQENIRLNRLGNVEAICGDCRDVSPEGIADRVIMGYFFNPTEFLSTALKTLAGRGVIHFHDLAKKEELPDRWKHISSLIEGRGYKATLTDSKIVKSYAPKIWHVVFDIEIR
jgi:tRNA wybutosine-synthesizing protein 2